MLFLAIAILTMAISPVYGVAVLIIVFHFGVGYLISAIDGDIHDLAQDHTRSSLFSLKRLIMRLVSSGYLLIYGLFISRDQFTLLMVCLGTAMLITVLITKKYSSAKPYLQKERPIESL